MRCTMILMTEQKPVTLDTAKAVPALPDAQTVTEVKHYTDRLFSFRVTRPASLRFRSGEFVMIGLMGEFYTRKHASISWMAGR